MEEMIQKNYSDLKIVWHPDKLKSLSEKRITAPIYLRIQPTGKCNHNCFYCIYNPEVGGIHSEINRNDEIPYKKMLKILSEFKEIGVKAVTYSGGGEPLIYPHIEEAMEKTLEYGIDLSIITNGQELKGEKAEILKEAKWVRISTDSCNAEIFTKIRRKPESWFNELANNIKSFSEIKNPKCVLGINFVVNDINKEKVYESAKFFKELGVDNIKFTPAWTKNFLQYHEPFKDEVVMQIKKARELLQDSRFEIYDTYQKDFSLTGSSKRTYSKCFIMQIIPIIGADCKVYFCHNKAYDKSGLLGSIKNKSFKELWFSKEAKKIFESFNPSLSCQHQCTNDYKNILIRDILGSGGHVNFV